MKYHGIIEHAYGMIQIDGNSLSFPEIKLKYSENDGTLTRSLDEKSIDSYLRESNDSHALARAQERFIRSCAANTLARAILKCDTHVGDCAYLYIGHDGQFSGLRFQNLFGRRLMRFGIKRERHVFFVNLAIKFAINAANIDKNEYYSDLNANGNQRKNKLKRNLMWNYFQDLCVQALDILRNEHKYRLLLMLLVTISFCDDGCTDDEINCIQKNDIVLNVRKVLHLDDERKENDFKKFVGKEFANALKDKYRIIDNCIHQFIHN